MTNEAGNLEVVRRVYDALEQDDVAALLGLCDPTVEWSYPAEGVLPYGGSWRGADGTAGFLEAHDAAEEILDFHVDEMVANGDRVVVYGFFRGRAKPSGVTWETRFVHTIALLDGRMRRLEACFDTAAAVAAHGGASSA